MVSSTRFEPEVFVPPLPGDEVRKAERRAAQRGPVLRHDAEAAAGRPVPRRRAVLPQPRVPRRHPRRPRQHQRHLAAWPPRPPTPRSSSTPCSTPACSAPRPRNTKALVFNVKGEDLLFLDHPNTAARRRRGRALRGPRPRPRAVLVGRGVRAAGEGRRRRPARRRQPARGRVVVLLDDRGVLPAAPAAVPLRRRRGRPPAVPDGRAQRRRPAGARRAGRRRRRQHRRAGRAHLPRPRRPDRAEGRPRRRRPVGRPGHRLGHDQRLRAPPLRRRRPRAAPRARPTSPGPSGHAVDFDRAQVTVVDLHNLNDRAKRFVVGVILRQAFERKERSGQARPLQFVVLDELNKYAPREGSSPIKELLLDVAERGRSLGIILIGAQQTASEVERRVVANSAIRVVGRLDAGEAARGEYGFLPAAQRQRATIIKPGTMVVSQPEVPDPDRRAVPVPGVGDAGVRGRDPPRVRPARRPLRGVLRSGAMKLLHTSDWHVGKAIRGRSRADEHAAVLAEMAADRRAGGRRPRARRRRPVRRRRPAARGRAHRLRRRCWR